MEGRKEGRKDVDMDMLCTWYENQGCALSVAYLSVVLLTIGIN